MVVSSQEAEQLIQGIRILYGLDIIAVVERRTVCGLVGSNANWIWKPILETDDEQRLLDLARITHTISQQGILCGGPVPDKNGRFITVPYPNAKPGYLQMWLPGRHVNVQNRLERRGAIRTIGKLHMLSSQPFFQMTGTLRRGNLLSKLKMKQKTMVSIWPEASRHSSVLMPLEGYVRDTMEHCIHEYEHWLRGNGPHYTFCHRDLAPHNMLWHQVACGECAVSMIDFDHSGFDDPFHDVLQFASHTIFLSDCSLLDIEQLIMDYGEETGLEKERIRLLWLLLSWPDILIRTVVEWCRHGYDKDKEIRVVHAVKKEEKRRRLLNDTTYVRRI